MKWMTFAEYVSKQTHKPEPQTSLHIEPIGIAEHPLKKWNKVLKIARDTGQQMQQRKYRTRGVSGLRSDS
jgi:hypothetical protein